VSADFVNRSALQTVSVVGLTSNLRWAGAPGNVLLEGGSAGVNQDSVVNVTKLLTLDRSDMDARIGRVPRTRMREVDAGLRRVLDL
jgi:mRNA interferase MazF